MTQIEAAPRGAGLKDWLLTNEPQSARQARLGRAYVTWTVFTENRLALLGLGIVLLLVVVAALAPLLATHPPNVQTLSDRLQPPSLGHWPGTDEFGRDIYSRIVYGSSEGRRVGNECGRTC